MTSQLNDDTELFRAAMRNIRDVPEQEYSDYENEVFEDSDSDEDQTGSYWPAFPQRPPVGRKSSDDTDDDYAHVSGNASPVQTPARPAFPGTLRRRLPPPLPSINGVQIVRQAAKLPPGPPVPPRGRPQIQPREAPRRPPFPFPFADDDDYDYAYVKDADVSKLVLAKAQYDNAGDSRDELTFYRGDVLTVLDDNPEGLSGWWLCLLNGRRGIAPGNRLQILSPARGTPAAAGPAPPPAPPAGSTHGAGAGLQGDLYQTPPAQNGGVNWHRRSWHMHPNKSELSRLRSQYKPLTCSVQVVTPQKLGGVYIYDQPNLAYQDYDVPPSRYFPAVPPGGVQNGRLSGDGAPSAVYDTPGGTMRRTARGAPPPGPDSDVYDVPPAAHAHIPIGSLSPSNRSSTTSVQSTGSTATVSSGTSSPGRWAGSNPPSTCGSARSSTEVQDIYDVPPPAKAVCPKSPLAVKQDGSYPQLSTPRILNEDYSCPMKKTEPFRDTDSGIVASKEEGAYDVPVNYITQNNKGEHDIDNIYDHPTNNAPTVGWAGQGRVQGLSVAGGLQDGSVYDIPPQVTRDSAISMRSDCSSLMDEVSSRLSSCSVASSGGSSDVPPVPYDELPLDLDAALELLVKLQQEVHSATSRLLSFVHSAWRQREELEPKLYDVKLGCLGVQATLKEFVDFGQGALANSAKADDKKLVKKLKQLLEPLQEGLKTVVKCMGQLNDISWSINVLVTAATHPAEGDALGTIVTQAKEVPGTVRIMASCIQGNSTLLFKRQQQVDGGRTPSMNSSPKKIPPPVRPKPPVLPKPKPGTPQIEVSLERRTSMQDRPLPAPPVRTDQLSPVGPGEESSAVYEVPHGDEEDLQDKDSASSKYTNKEDFLEDYDYVHLENRPPPAADSSSRVDGVAEDETDSGIVTNDSGSGSGSGGSGLTSKFQERLQLLQGGGPTEPQDNNNVSKSGPVLHPNDKQLLAFYAGQVGAHTAQLVNTIDAFFQCIEYNQPPKVFIAHSKTVVMAAHRMVYICDTIHRNLLNEEVRVKVMACANYLCDCLKLVVTATKSAALQYPSVVTVQEMVDRVVDVSHASNEIKLVITQAAIL